MTNETNPVCPTEPAPVSAGAKIAGGWLIIVFVLGLIGWVAALPGLGIIVREAGTYPDPGDAAIGILVLAILMGGASMILLALGSVLAFLAKGMPTWFRVLTVVSPTLGLVVTVLLLLRCGM